MAEPHGTPASGCRRAEGLSRASRIRKRPDFERVYSQGTRYRGALFTMFVLRTTQTTGRIGVAATRKLGGAVIRNRAKRLVREVWRRHKAGSSFDVVVVPKREMLNAGSERVAAEFVALLGRQSSSGPSGRPGRPGPPDRAARL